jgi:hypothetical protein
MESFSWAEIGFGRLMDVSAFIPHIGFFEFNKKQVIPGHPLIAFLKRSILSNSMEFVLSEKEAQFKHIADSSLEVFDNDTIRDALHAMITWFIGKSLIHYLSPIPYF